MRRLIILLIFGLTSLLTATAVRAFEGPGGPGGPGGGSQYQLMEIKRQQLGPALGVDQRTVEQLLNIDRRFQPQRQQLNQAAKAEFQNLSRIMSQQNPPEEQVRQSLQAVRQKRLDMLNLQQRQEKEEMAVLTPIQQARYLLFQMGLRRQMMKEAKGQRHGPGGPQPVAPRPDLREVPVVGPPR